MKAKKDKPLILVTNDDSIKAPGLRFLISLVRPFGKLVVVAPDRPQSGTAHAVTVNHPLRLELIAKSKDYEEYSCNGTPADCVKLAFKVVLKKRPDFLFSGINHGSNSSINIIYSGTMAAVLEGALAGVSSVGFSLADYRMDADFTPSASYLKEIITRVIEHSLPEGICLNVNIPAISKRKIKGIRVCRQAAGTWQEDFDARTDPHGRKYYWMTGVFIKTDHGPDTDEWALEHDYIAVVPVQFDFTAVKAMKPVSSLFE